MEQRPASENTPAPAPPGIDLVALIPLITHSAQSLMATASEYRDKGNAQIVADNKEQLKLWNRALWLEGALILTVLLCGFGACAAFAISGQTASAEKIAFALFGFIGGRGFLSIRALINSATKRDGM